MSGDRRVLVEKLINKIVKISYFQYRNNQKTERYIHGKLIAADANFIQIEGLRDEKIFTINTQHIIEIVDEGD